MTLDEIRQLRDELEPYSYAIGGIQIKFPFKTDEVCLTAFPAGEERFKEMQRVLEPYKKRFIRIDLELRPDPSLCWKFLSRIDFFKMKTALVAALRAEIDALIKRSDPEPLYAFVVGVSPEHHNIAIYWNTPSHWASKKTAYEARGYPARAGTQYTGAEFFGESLAAGENCWNLVRDCLWDQEEVCREYFDLTRGQGVFSELYENRFRSTAIHALKEVANDLERLPRTPDFIYFVEDYVGAGDDLFLKLETVPEEQLRRLLPDLFSTAAVES